MITVFISHLFLTLASLLAPKAPAADHSKLHDGYYRGSVFLLNVFMRVSGDTAFVDFVSWDKFPRDVRVDTLYYNLQHDSWTGKYTELTTKREKHYIRQKEQSPSPILGEKVDLRMKSEEELDSRKVDPRNRAMLNAYYLEFLKKHNTPEKRLLYYQALYQMVTKHADHDLFRKQFEMYRTTLEGKIAATND